jgi:hypothetical protein
MLAQHQKAYQRYHPAIEPRKIPRAFESNSQKTWVIYEQPGFEGISGWRASGSLPDIKRHVNDTIQQTYMCHRHMGLSAEGGSVDLVA